MSVSTQSEHAAWSNGVLLGAVTVEGSINGCVADEDTVVVAWWCDHVAASIAV